MRTVVSCWRWPCLRREFWRRRFLKAMTVLARPCSTTSAVTSGAFDEGRAERHVVAFAMREHLADFDDIADFAGDLLDLQYVVGGDAILLAARFDDCEHFLPFAVRSAWFRAQAIRPSFCQSAGFKVQTARRGSTPDARCP